MTYQNHYNYEILKRYYDEDYYADVSLKSMESSFQKYRIKKILEIYKPSKNERIVDIGCGLGTVSFSIAPICKEVIGIDFSKKAIESCRKRLKEMRLGNVHFAYADAQNTGLGSEEYDVIISADLFEHLYPDVFEKVLDECKRVLQIGGKLVIWTPNRGHLFEMLKNNNIILKKDISHVHYKSMSYLVKNLTERNFTIRRAFYAESHIPLLNITERLFMSNIPILRRRIAILAEKQ